MADELLKRGLAVHETISRPFFREETQGSPFPRMRLRSTPDFERRSGVVVAAGLCVKPRSAQRSAPLSQSPCMSVMQEYLTRRHLTEGSVKSRAKGALSIANNGDHLIRSGVNKEGKIDG